MKKFYLYIHTCPNGKKYVGITIRRPEYRWRKGEGYKSNKHFYSAIQKYGWDNIEHQVFEVDTKEEMFFLEKYFIAYYQTNNPDFGYNNSIGGEKISEGCHYVFTDEHKKKLSESQKGRHLSIETRHKLSESHKGNQYHKGKHHSAEAKRKMSEAKKGVKRGPHSEEHKRKISEAKKGKPSRNKGCVAWNKGIPCSEEHKRKISEANKGKSRSEETKRKISEARKGKSMSDEQKKKISNSLKGFHHSEETKAKMKGRIPWNKGLKKEL